MVGVWKQEQATKIHRELCRTSCPQIAWCSIEKKPMGSALKGLRIYIYDYIDGNLLLNLMLGDVGCIPRIKKTYLTKELDNKNQGGQCGTICPKLELTSHIT